MLEQQPGTKAKSLVDRIRMLSLGKVGEMVRARVGEFKALNGKGNEEWFSELCYCILTANSPARLGMEIQRELGVEKLLSYPVEELSKELQRMGHRFYERRSEYIVQARRFRNIRDLVTRLPDERSARVWLAENVKGLGFKEASHFLRNVGYTNVAILDRHILKVLHTHSLTGDIYRLHPRSSLTLNRYLRIERRLEALAKDAGLELGELDLYLWYMETEEVLK